MQDISAVGDLPVLQSRRRRNEAGVRVAEAGGSLGASPENQRPGGPGAGQASKRGLNLEKWPVISAGIGTMKNKQHELDLLVRTAGS
jgi:hypothetical protein